MGRLVILPFFLLMVALFPAKSSAQVYKYIDKDGVVHFTNAPTDPRYKSYMAADPEKKEALGIRPSKRAENYKAPSQENKKLDDLKDLDDLEDLGELPPLSLKP